MLLKICPQCGNEFIVKKYAHLKMYCARKCYRQSDAFKASTKKYKQSKKGKAAEERYYKSEVRAEAVRKYKQTKKGKEITQLSQRKYRIKNKEKVKVSQKKYNQSEKGKQYFKVYRQSDKFKFKLNVRNRKRYREDISFKYKVSLSARLRAFYKSKNLKKTNKTLQIVGCTSEFLKEYLEKKFYPHPETNEYMTHENHGTYGWHIDHIIPLDSAKNEEELKKLCHYTNLQPMWALDNIKKSNKII
jgi:hypothetical protein